MFLTIDAEDSAEQVRTFLQDNNYTFLVLLDSDHQVSTAYNIFGVPITYLIDEDGVIQKVKIGAYLSIDEIEAQLESIMD